METNTRSWRTLERSLSLWICDTFSFSFKLKMYYRKKFYPLSHTHTRLKATRHCDSLKLLYNKCFMFSGNLSPAYIDLHSKYVLLLHTFWIHFQYYTHNSHNSIYLSQPLLNQALYCNLIYHDMTIYILRI